MGCALPQDGEVVCFERRKPAQSQLTEDIISLEKLFDFIRMLDARDYPCAYLEVGNFRFEIRRPALRTECIQADITITLLNK